MEKSRQVLRAEFRRELKKGEAAGKRTARMKKQRAREARRTSASTLRIAAINAVSRLTGFGRAKSFAE